MLAQRRWTWSTRRSTRLPSTRRRTGSPRGVVRSARGRPPVRPRVPRRTRRRRSGRSPRRATAGRRRACSRRVSRPGGRREVRRRRVQPVGPGVERERATAGSGNGESALATTGLRVDAVDVDEAHGETLVAVHRRGVAVPDENHQSTVGEDGDRPVPRASRERLFGSVFAVDLDAPFPVREQEDRRLVVFQVRLRRAVAEISRGEQSPVPVSVRRGVSLLRGYLLR